jgi:hypothetical protein
MNSTHPSRSFEIRHVGAAPQEGEVEQVSPAAHAESLQRTGKKLVIAGFVVTIAGVIGYCAACFTAGFNADMGDLLLHNTVPFARATLAVLGLGTLVWAIGSLTYLRGVMDADESSEDGPDPL